jgi:glucose-6-phosphate 1-dehydrogenase
LLVLRIQPEEGIGLHFALKQPGEPPQTVPAALDFTYREAFGVAPPDAYQRLLLDALRGDSTLFTRSDETEACWRFCDPILEAWSKAAPTDFPNYEPGAWGPAASDDLLRRDGRAWRQPDR